MKARDDLAEEYRNALADIGNSCVTKRDFKAGWDAHAERVKGLVEALDKCLTEQDRLFTNWSLVEKALAAYRGEP